MKIALVGPGYMEIPPKSWGAVEILMWDCKSELERIGNEVTIINTRNREEIISQCNDLNPDFIHIHFDRFFDVVPKLKCKNVAITSHFGYIEQKDKYYLADFQKIHNGIISLPSTKIFCLSPEIKQVYIKDGVDERRLHITPNGVAPENFSFSESPKRPECSIYLAKIEYRKRQCLFHNIEGLCFAGRIEDSRYNKNNYLGEWKKEQVYSELTDFANLVLLSDGEAHPLVCMEALSSGLGLVVSEYAKANLNASLPFIDVINEESIKDIDYVSEVIKNNRKKSIQNRHGIREYAESMSWKNIVKNYYLKAINT